MKSLRSILGAQLVLGCLAAMAVILAVRTASYHGEAVERTQLGVAAAMEDVAWEIARQRRATLQGAVLLAEHLDAHLQRVGEHREAGTGLGQVRARVDPSLHAAEAEGLGSLLHHGSKAVRPLVHAGHLVTFVGHDSLLVTLWSG